LYLFHLFIPVPEVAGDRVKSSFLFLLPVNKLFTGHHFGKEVDD
jgi:hypothetical protein